jgi:hypothetical protein
MSVAPRPWPFNSRTLAASIEAGPALVHAGRLGCWSMSAGRLGLGTPQWLHRDWMQTKRKPSALLMDEESPRGSQPTGGAGPLCDHDGGITGTWASTPVRRCR